MLSIFPLSSVFTILSPDFWVVCQLFCFSRVNTRGYLPGCGHTAPNPHLWPQPPPPSPLKVGTSATLTVLTAPYRPVGQKSGESKEQYRMETTEDSGCRATIPLCRRPVSPRQARQACATGLEPGQASLVSGEWEDGLEG